MANDKMKFQPWDETAFRGDPEVYYLSAVARWIYRTLCQAAFICDTRPYLPDDDSALWKLAQCDSLNQWLEYSKEVRNMFEPITQGVTQGALGLLKRKRIINDWDRAIEAYKQFEAARDLSTEQGRIGGSSTSPVKQQAARENGLMGGRPINQAETREITQGGLGVKPKANPSLTLTLTELNVNKITREEPKFTPTLNLEDIWDTATRLFRKKIGRTMPEPYPKTREGFDTLVREYGDDIILDAFTEWAESRSDSFRKNKTYGIRYFVDKPEHWIQDQLNKKQEEEIEREERLPQGESSVSQIEHHEQCASRRGKSCDCVGGN